MRRSRTRVTRMRKRDGPRKRGESEQRQKGQRQKGGDWERKGRLGKADTED